MKTLKLLSLGILFAIFINNGINAQATIANNNTSGSNYLGFSSTGNDLPFSANGFLQMYLLQTGNLNLVGSTNGYMLDSHMFLWNGGMVSDVFIGVAAAGTGTSTPSLFDNTVIGNSAGYDLGATGSTGLQNSIVGSNSGYSLTTGTNNTYMGYYAGYTNAIGSFNTFLGAYAGQKTTGGAYPNGYYNTMTGFECGLSNVSGHTNCYYGKLAGYSNNGNYNCFYGGHTGSANSSTDSNSMFGTYANDNGVYGNDNVYLGMHSAFKSGISGYSNYNAFIGGLTASNFPYGNYNILIGYEADAYTIPSGGGYGVINNAAAIGASAIVNYDNQVILGNNEQFVGIGESSDHSFGGVGPQWNLEIATEHNSAGSGGIYSTLNGYTPTSTGFSGLRFRDLTASSIPANLSEIESPPSGVLSVDNTGRVIYVEPPAATFGTCSSPSVLSTSGGIDMHNAGNFYFLGNGAGSAKNNVSVGWSACSTPYAKFNVAQHSGSNNSVAEYVTNNDYSSGTIGAPQPLYGLISYIPASPTYPASYHYNVAGWFEADESPQIGRYARIKQYAIFVPQAPTPYLSSYPYCGGTVDIGYAFGIDNPTFLLKVNGYINTPSWTSPSDTILKKNVAPFNYGLKAIRKLNPITYQYNGMGGFDSTHTYVGLIAENLERNVPNGIVPSLITKDTVTRDTITIQNICQEAVLYTAVNAIKQLDSTVSKHDSNDWKITGNIGTTSANYLGTRDSVNLIFKANNIKSGLIDLSHKNTAFGHQALYSVADTNAGGYYNVATGAGALARNINGNSNTATGTLSLYNNVADSNTANGDSSLYYVNQGSGNSALGYKAGLSHANTQGDDNTFLGDMTDVNPPPGSSVNGSTAVGAKAIVAASNQLELGDNDVTTSLGLSGYAPGQGPVRLEVNTQHGASPFTVASGSIPPAYINGGAGTGWSGVRFDDLTSADLPAPNPGQGVLGLDQTGDIIYVNASQSSSFSPSPCPLLNSIPMGGIGYVFNPNSNFYFNGNNSGNVGDESVIIGNGCSHLPLAKLDVLQSTGSGQPSIGLYVENDDRVCSTQPLAVIGIKSYLPAAPESGSVNQIAGWFEADNATNCCNSLGQYALYVPQYGGTVSIGWPYASNTCSPGWMLTVNGTCNNFGGYFHGSDSTVKTNVHPLTNAMSVINRLQGVSYNFVPAVINDSAMGGLHYGMLAQAVKRVIPGAVRRMNYNNSGSLLSLSYDDIVPWLVEGIKQQQLQISADSSLIQNLTNTLNSYIHCLDSLCRSSHAPIQGNGNGGNGNSTGDINPNNSQDVALSSSTTPILYQNKPNPYQKETTINYFLPEGTMGAKMLFFDSYGSQLKSVDLTQTGNGTLNVSADNLSAGIYTYSLVVDNKVIDTKRMILQK